MAPDEGEGRLYNSTASRGTLPEAASASAPQDKLQGYLLNHEHPAGRKIPCDQPGPGLQCENWKTFQKKLLTEVQKSPVTKTVSTQFGERYTVPVILYGRRPVPSPEHRLADRHRRKDPHFITATPERKK